MSEKEQRHQRDYMQEDEMMAIPLLAHKDYGAPSVAWDATHVPLYVGTSWTTDAPFRETEQAIAAYRAEGILAVEMEAAALSALAITKQKDIVCFAHVTNQMGQTEGDFEKGEAAGSATALHVISQTAQRWQCWQRQQFVEK